MGKPRNLSFFVLPAGRRAGNGREVGAINATTYGAVDHGQAAGTTDGTQVKQGQPSASHVVAPSTGHLDAPIRDFSFCVGHPRPTAPSPANKRIGAAQPGHAA